MLKIGNREQVYQGEAEKTTGGLIKKDLYLDESNNKIKSVKASQKAKELAKNRKNKPKPNNVKKLVQKYESNFEK